MKNTNLEIINNYSQNSLVGHLGIVFTEIGADYIVGKMPVDERTIQPFGLLHGGASVVLAETLASFGSANLIDMEKQSAAGIEVNANHLKSVRSGFVSGIAKLLHHGKKIHVWEIKITNDTNELVCVSRLTVAILDKTQKNN